MEGHLSAENPCVASHILCLFFFFFLSKPLANELRRIILQTQRMATRVLCGKGSASHTQTTYCINKEYGNSLIWSDSNYVILITDRGEVMAFHLVNPPSSYWVTNLSLSLSNARGKWYSQVFYASNWSTPEHSTTFNENDEGYVFHHLCLLPHRRRRQL